MLKRMTMVLAVVLAAGPALSWDGYDADSGASIEIEKGNLVRSGRDIEIYDYDAGEYRDVTVESIRDRGSTVEVEVYDHDSGEYRILEMDQD